MKTLLVLEGGAFRGTYTAAIIDKFIEDNVNIDAIIGVSAGALIAPNYYSRQIGRCLNINRKYCKDSRYMGKKSLIETGNFVNKDFAYYNVTKNIEVFDEKEYEKNYKLLLATVSNVETGLPEYIKVNNVYNQIEVLRASSAMPFLTNIVEVNNNYYLDGAICDSIPIKKALSLEYDRIIVILTREKGFIKKPFNKGEIIGIKTKYKKYPKFIKAMLNRYKQYNESLEIIDKLSSENKIFAIYPSENIDISLNKVNKKEIDRIYDIGIKDYNNIKDKLNEYLNSK